MAEYIDRNRLIKKFCNHCYFDVGEKNCAEDCYDMKIIKSLPIEDVQPVKHGRWIDGDSRCVTAVCSNCNCLRLGNGAKSATRLALYCERCGARMDGET